MINYKNCLVLSFLIIELKNVSFNRLKADIKCFNGVS